MPSYRGVSMSSFFSQLTQRRVYRVAIGYAIAAWLAVQIAATVLPAFHAPEFILPVLIVLLGVGFPVALVLAWAFDVTPAGIEKTPDAGGAAAAKDFRHVTMLAAIGLLIAAIGVGAYWFWHSPSRKQLFAASSATEPAPKTSASPPAAAVREQSIAVLPFENLSEDKSNAFFADGVQDEILTDLAKVADLKVISRTSVMQYRDKGARNLREIAQQLGVAHVLEGSVQRAERKIRVNAQLIDARNDAHLWAQTYDRDLADVFAIQSEIAKTIAEQLQAKLSPKEEAVVEAKPTKDLAAYDLYLRAMEIERNRSSSVGSGGVEVSKREIEYLDQAVARDPEFVPALCRLANTHLYLLWVSDRSAPHLELAKKALEAAARLQPDSGEVHFTRGLLYYRGSRDYAPALAEFALAQRSSPNDANVPFLIAMVERRQGRWEQCLQHLQQALALDPHNLAMIPELSTTYFILRRFDDSSKTLENALAWKPRDFSLSLLLAWNDAHAKADLGRWKALVNGGADTPADPNDLISARLTLALFERDYRAAEQAVDTPGMVEFDDNGFFLPRELVRGIAARGLGDKARANEQFLAARQRAAAAAQENPNDARALILLGQIDAALGRKEDAIREGEHAAEMLPPSKDSINGGLIQQKLGGIYAQTGNADRAFRLLETAAKIPAGVTYGSLKLEEEWDPIRHDPRFEKIVQSLAPK